MFREAVLRRELSGEMAYDKQRDHSSHTLYNYLLGWYFFIFCPNMKEALRAEFEKRGVPNDHLEPFQLIAKYFGSVWQYTSLLHDIGYMFEGSLSRMSFEDSSSQAAIGAQIAHQHFDRAIWLDYNIDLSVERSQLLDQLGDQFEPPSFDQTNAIASIADRLRCLGDLRGLLPHVHDALRQGGLSDGRKPEADCLTLDAFVLWSHHYERFDNPRMAQRFRSLRKVFNGLIDVGLPDVGIRMLDHGVCGGLLQLLASTYYYRLRAGALSTTEPRSLLASRVVDSGGWSPAFWWTGIVWGTAAVVLHNIQQMSDAGKIDSGWPGKLSLSGDPLAYLGVLVDILQEWNRYSVKKAIGREPIQGIEVQLGVQDGKILVRFEEPESGKRAKKVVKGLDEALEGWRDILDIQPT